MTDGSRPDDGPKRRGSGPDWRRDATTWIVVAAANPLYRAGLLHALGREPDFEIVGETDAVAATVAAAADATPDVAVVDLGLPDPGGLAATRQIRHEAPAIAVVVIGSDEDDEEVFAAVRAGAAA